MRQKTFNAPTTSELLKMNGLVVSGKVNSDYILGMLNEGNFVFAGNSFFDAVVSVENNRNRNNSVVLFPSRFQVTGERYNRMAKSLEWLVKVDSQPILRSIGGQNAPKELTMSFLEQYKIKPETLVRAAMQSENIENPPIGFYWYGQDNTPRVATWLQSAEASEIMVMHSKKDFVAGKVIDKIPYGRNMRVEVSSRSKLNSYQFSLLRMPIFKNQKDPKIYSYWVNMSHTSPDPLSNYMTEHSQQVLPQCFWSTTAIVGVYLGMSHLNKFHNPLQFRINPFPIPVDSEEVDFMDGLRLRSLIIAKNKNGDKVLRPLNKTEMNRVLGARTIKRGYDSCWFNMGKKGLDYLYTPSL